MNDQTIKMTQLIEELNKYSHEYYVLDSPSVSDAEFDRKFDALLELEKETDTVLENSPTNRVGGGILEGFEKVTHKSPLLSLNKAQTHDELESFYNSMIDEWSRYDKTGQKLQFIVMEKLDGLTLNESFVNGQISVAATRGTGTIGENITEQAKTINNVPHNIPYALPISFHGEAVMTKKAFAEYNKTAKEPLKNLRNGAAGALRNLNLAETSKRKLSAMFYAITDSEYELKTLEEELKYMQQLNLPVVDYRVATSLGDIKEEIQNIQDRRESLQYDIDGVVIKVNNNAFKEHLGYTSRYPKSAIAFKFEAEESTTILLDVEWTVGRTGRVNPVAILEPVDIGGTRITRATLNNMDNINKKGLGMGDEIVIRRSNDVIPEILSVVDDSAEHEPIIPPTICPSCSEALTKEGIFIMCTNTLGCPPQLSKNIVHFCGREAMDIVGLSDKTAEQLIAEGIIDNVADLYNIKDKKDVATTLPRFGEKKFDKLVDEIERSTTMPANRFLYALGIENVGRSASKELMNHFGTLDAFMKATDEELLQVPDVGDTMVHNIRTWFGSTANRTLLNRLLDYITLEEIVVAEAVESPFTDKSIVITGSMKQFTRSEIKKHLESMGAKVRGSVSKNTDYLIAGEKAGSKLTKALEIGVKVLSEEEFGTIMNQ